MTQDELIVSKLATIYQLRLIIDSSDKEQYTKEELLKLLDELAKAKDQH